MIWTHREEHLKTFIGYLNSIHPSIQFTHEYSNSLHQTLPFLDVKVHLINNHIQTGLHTKPTDKHQYTSMAWCLKNFRKSPKAVLMSVCFATGGLTDLAKNTRIGGIPPPPPLRSKIGKLVSVTRTFIAWMFLFRLSL